MPAPVLVEALPGAINPALSMEVQVSNKFPVVVEALPGHLSEPITVEVRGLLKGDRGEPGPPGPPPPWSATDW